MSRLVHVFLAAWLVLALPLGQHEALLHALGHATEGSSGSETSPSPEKCPAHSLYAAFADAVGGGSGCVPAIATSPSAIAAPQPPVAAAAPNLAYLSRAPPGIPARP